MKKLFIPILAGLLITGVVMAADYVVKDKDKDDTLKVIEKVETVEVTTNISITEEINALNNDKADIESILGRFNAHLDRFNEAITADPSMKLKTLSEATCSFPTIPEVYVEPVVEPKLEEIIN